MFKKKKTYVILALIILIVGGFFYFRGRKPKVQYETAMAQKGNLTRTVSVTGKIVPPVESNAAFKISGQVKSIFVDVGDHVTKGQKIATVDTGTLSSQLTQAQNEVQVQKKTLKSMQRQGDTYNYYDKKAQEALIEKYQAAADEIQTQIGYATLYAPISGTIIKKNVEVGDAVTANALTSSTSVVTIASDGPLETQVDIPESDVVNVAVGQKANITLDAFSDNEQLEGVVSEIDPASTVIQDVVYYEAKLTFPHPDSRLKVGMSTNVDINTAEHDNVIMIPQRAIQSEGSQQYVQILKPDNTTQRINIQTGLVGDDGMVEVTSGLSGGEKVITLTKTQ